MAFGVERAFEFEHVCVLLGVDVVVREVYGYVFQLELHDLCVFYVSPERDRDFGFRLNEGEGCY